MSDATTKCPYCAEEIPADAIKCRYCREFLDEAAQGGDAKQKRWYQRTSVTLVVAAALAVFGLGFIHIVTGSNLDLPFYMEWKDSFGFSETFVNIDKITRMPWMFAKAEYPIGCHMLQKRGYIESDKAFERRTKREIEKLTAGLYNEATIEPGQSHHLPQACLNSDETERLRACQIAYPIADGLAAAGISFGEFLDRLSHSRTSPSVLTQSTDGKTVVTIREGTEALSLLFDCDASRGVCTITGGEIGDQEIASDMALAVMMSVTGQ